MSKNGGEARTDQELSDFVASRGLTLTPRQVRHYRSIGLIPKTERIFPGYALGSLASNSALAFEDALAIAQVRGEEKMGDDELALGILSIGRPVDPQRVRGAYAALFEGIDRSIRRVTRGGDSELDTADRFADQIRRSRRKSDGVQYLQRRAPSATEFYNLLSVFAGLLVGADIEQVGSIGDSEHDAISESMKILGIMPSADRVPVN